MVAKSPKVKPAKIPGVSRALDVGSRVRVSSARTQIKYDTVQLDRLRNRVRIFTCSIYWEDHCVAACIRFGVPPGSKHVGSALRMYRIFPPPAENTPMKPCWCKSCKGLRLFPAAYIRSSGVSFECAYDAMGRERMAAIGGSEAIVRVYADGRRDRL